MSKRILSSGGLFLAVFLISVSALAQESNPQLSFGASQFPRNTKIFWLNMNFSNENPVGGFEFQITTHPPGIIRPIQFNAGGGRIENWEFIRLSQVGADSSRLRIVGIANWPGGPNTPALPPGSGFIGLAGFQFECGYETDFSVIVSADSAFATDESGYQFYEIEVVDGAALIGDDTAIRGDANCNGVLIGSDVTYLVNYFRGVNPCPCSMRAGDANSDNQIIGSDVTYLVRYFADQGPPPGE